MADEQTSQPFDATPAHERGSLAKAQLKAEGRDFKEYRGVHTVENTSAQPAQEDAAAPANAPEPNDGWGSLSVDSLQAAAEARGLTVEGTGANGNVLKKDLVAALSA